MIQKFNKKQILNFKPMANSKYKTKFLNTIVVLGCVLLSSSCEDYFEPALTNDRSIEEILQDPAKVRGLLTYAYRAIPSAYDVYSGDMLDAATDNALSNNNGGMLSRMLELNGYYTYITNPFNGSWKARYDDCCRSN